VEEFIRGHSTSAIGIAGTRGVGKTTTIRHISTSKHDESIGTYIEAPVYYDAADFVRLIHAKVAESILRANRHTYIDPLKRTPIYSALLRLAIAFIGALIGFILIVAAQNDTFLLNRSQYVVGSLFITGSIVLAFSVLNILPQRSSAQMRRQRRFDAVSLARDALKSLRWQATVDTKATTRLKMFSILETEDTSDTSLAERERAHPERVADFKDFIRSYHETLHALPLVIAIDELDKIASAEKALELVNGLKDILHLTNTHFVVSVSEDALNSFALRGVPVRDVFDSSFDTVIHLRPLSAQESITLLKGRVVGFPESAALLCHVLSGGLPRDLIRAARRCIDQRRAADKPIPVHKLGQEVPRLELLDVIEAALRVRRFAEKTAEQKDVDTWLLRLREELRSGSAPMTGNTFEILKEGADLCASLSSASEIENILCIAAVLCTASQFTAVQRTSEEWMSLLDESGTQRGIELLAEARMAAATFPAQCRSQVREARQSLGLMPDLIL
jgi:Cdc6-like AAA superfamily ATPase